MAIRQRRLASGVLVLPTHVAVKHRRRALGHPLQQPVEQGCLLGLVDVDHATISLLPKLYTGAK